MCTVYQQGNVAIPGFDKPPMLVMICTQGQMFVECHRWLRCLRGDVISDTLNKWLRGCKKAVKDAMTYFWPNLSEPFDIPSYKTKNSIQGDNKSPIQLEVKLMSLHAAIATLHVILTRKSIRDQGMLTLCRFLNRLLEKLGGYGLSFKLEVAGIARVVHVSNDGSVPEYSFWDLFFFEFYGLAKRWHDMAANSPCLPYSDEATMPLAPGRSRLVDLFTFLSDPGIQNQYPQLVPTYDILITQLCQFMYDSMHQISSGWDGKVKSAWCLSSKAKYHQQWILQKSVRDGQAGMYDINNGLDTLKLVDLNMR